MDEPTLSLEGTKFQNQNLYRQLWKHGVPSLTAPPEDHRKHSDGHSEQMMRDTNAIPQRRIRGSERGYDVASENNEVENMHRLDLQLTECADLMCNLG